MIYCPTGQTIADYMSKPLQGYLFHKFRNLVLGISEKDFEQYEREYEEVIKRYGLDDNERDDNPAPRGTDDVRTQ